MKSISPTCRELAQSNLSSLPERFVYRRGQATYEAIQEVFWACMVELTAELLDGKELPDRVPVTREQIVIAVAADQWRGLQAELGLNQSSSRFLVGRVLESQLRRKGRKTMLLPAGHTLAECLNARLLGFVLFTCHIDKLSEAGPVRHFAYEFRELTHLASRELNWVPIGSFDEGKVSREFCDYAGMRIQASDRLLYLPYHAFWRVLRPRLGGAFSTLMETHSNLPDEPVAHDFLLRSLPEVVQSLPVESAPQVPASPPASDSQWNGLRRELLDEVNRLRQENDRLRHNWGGEAVAAILTPLLALPECPTDAAERALQEAPVLVRDILHGVLRLLRSPELELYGEPGEVLKLCLPDPNYRLDEALPPSRDDISAGRFRVSSRGIRLRGVQLLAARVHPLKEGVE